MAYGLTEEQRDLRDALRRFCEEKSPIAEVRRLMETDDGYDPDVWKQMAVELGLQGVAIPEACGGQGLGAVELGIVMGELGRALLCAPYLSSVVLAGGAVRHVADEAQRIELLGGISEGETAALALNEPGAGWDPAEVKLEATPDGDAYRLSGAKTLVVDGATAAHVLVLARVPGTSGAEGLTLLRVDGPDPGMRRTPLQTLDPTRKQARLDFDGVRARALGDPGAAAGGIRRALDEAAIALAAEMVGGLELVVETAVQYARERVQFGRPIGSFQAIKHKCADMWTALEAARSATRFAAAAIDGDEPDVPQRACAAKAAAGEAYVHGASENIQIHGGVGFTWEYDAHLYYRRAKASDILLGGAAEQRERLIELLT